MVKYWLEVHAAAHTLVTDLLKVSEGEIVAVTIDTEADRQVAEAVAAAAHSVGAKPFIFSNPSPEGVGKAADPALPLRALTPALAGSDVWVEFNNEWLLYSSAFEGAMETGTVRHLCLVGMDADMMVRTIGRVDINKLLPFWTKIAELTEQCTELQITTPAGTDLQFKQHPEAGIWVSTGVSAEPGPHFLGGQISWIPDLESIEGTLVFDGSVSPPVGKLADPVILDIHEGRVTGIDGGAGANEFRLWLESFKDPNMFRLAHVCYGLNPGAKLTGNILEDERVWGCTEWGLGYISPNPAVPEGIPAKSHTDGICLNSTVKGDVGTILELGKVVHPELVALL